MKKNRKIKYRTCEEFKRNLNNNKKKVRKPRET